MASDAQDDAIMMIAETTSKKRGREGNSPEETPQTKRKKRRQEHEQNVCQTKEMMDVTTIEILPAPVSQTSISDDQSIEHLSEADTDSRHRSSHGEGEPINEIVEPESKQIEEEKDEIRRAQVVECKDSKEKSERVAQIKKLKASMIGNLVHFHLISVG